MYVAESGNWYTQEGEPAYTVPNKSKGGFRPTRITDAKKLNLYPSVTSVLKVLAAPALENWKVDQGILAALTLPRLEGESDDAFLKRVKKDSQEQASKAAEIGKNIHANLERHFRGEPPEEDSWPFVKGIVEAIHSHCGDQEWIPERTFVNTAWKYGGAIDLHSNYWFLDVKGKDFTEDNPPKPYDENGMQLAAYRAGMMKPWAKCANVFFSRNIPGLVHIVDWDEDELKRCLEMFYHCLHLWKLQKRYEPK